MTSAPTTAEPATTVPAAATAATAQVTIVNTFSGAVKVGVNGTQYQLAPAETRGPLAVTPSPSGNDMVGVTMVSDPTCGMGGARKYFDAGRSYTVTVITQASCLGAPAPATVVSAS